MHIQALAQQLDAQLEPAEADREIFGVATLEEATTQEVTFLSNPKYISKVRSSRAGAILVAQDFDASGLMLPILRVKHPYLAFAKAIELFHRKPQQPRGVHPTAVIGESVVLGEGVSIGAYVVISDGVTVGDNVVIHPHCMIYEGAVIGANSVLHSHAVVREQVHLGTGVILQNSAIIGSDGFGFVPLPDGSFYKILQAGKVSLGNNVEVQALSAIDRATIGTTEVGEGSKIDNLVQVGHGSKIGQHSLLCGQVGLAGSTEIGNHVILAGKVGAAGHLKIEDQAVAAAGSQIAKSVRAGETVMGYPAMEQKRWVKAIALFKDLPNIVQRLRKLEKQMEQWLR